MPTVKKKSPVMIPFKTRATDWALTLIIGLVIPFLLQHYIPPHNRHIELNDPSITHPYLPDICPTSVVLVLSYFGPSLIYLALCPSTLRNIHIFTLGIFETNALTIFLTEIFKLMAGRPRPHFAAVCEGYDSNGNCKNKNIGEVWEAMKSFPSGHSSLAFGAAAFLTAWLAEWVRIKEAGMWRLGVVLLPMVLAGAVGVSRTVDYHHFYGDVVGGALIGVGIGFVTWKSRKKDIVELGATGEGQEVDDGVSYDAVAVV